MVYRLGAKGKSDCVSSDCASSTASAGLGAICQMPALPQFGLRVCHPPQHGGYGALWLAAARLDARARLPRRLAGAVVRLGYRRPTGSASSLAGVKRSLGMPVINRPQGFRFFPSDDQ